MTGSYAISWLASCNAFQMSLSTQVAHDMISGPCGPQGNTSKQTREASYRTCCAQHQTTLFLNNRPPGDHWNPTGRLSYHEPLRLASRSSLTLVGSTAFSLTSFRSQYISAKSLISKDIDEPKPQVPRSRRYYRRASSGPSLWSAGNRQISWRLLSPCCIEPRSAYHQDRTPPLAIHE